MIGDAPVRGRQSYDRGLADSERPDDIPGAIRDYMFQPVYPHYA